MMYDQEMAAWARRSARRLVTEKTERQAAQRHVRDQRREAVERDARYRARAADYPDPEPRGVYRP